MTFSPLDWLGILAGALTTLSFVPQVLRIARTRSADDISWGMFTVFATGTTLWIAWGTIQHAIPVILANSVTLVLTFVILALKWRYSKPAAKSRIAQRVEPTIGLGADD
jgi:MtN3 and saliva related transmembrane protein